MLLEIFINNKRYIYIKGMQVGANVIYSYSYPTGIQENLVNGANFRATFTDATLFIGTMSCLSVDKGEIILVCTAGISPNIRDKLYSHTLDISLRFVLEEKQFTLHVI
jgi:hypothetical protein